MAAVFYTAERQLGTRAHEVIDENAARRDLRNDPFRPAPIAREDRGAKPKAAGICNLDRLRLVADADDRTDWPEQFLLECRHSRSHATEHGCPIIKSRPVDRLPTEQHARAGANALFHLARQLFPQVGTGERPDLGRRFRGVSHHTRFHPGDKAALKVTYHGTHNDETFRADAALA